MAVGSWDTVKAASTTGHINPWARSRQITILLEGHLWAPPHLQTRLPPLGHPTLPNHRRRLPRARPCAADPDVGTPSTGAPQATRVGARNTAQTSAWLGSAKTSTQIGPPLDPGEPTDPPLPTPTGPNKPPPTNRQGILP